MHAPPSPPLAPALAAMTALQGVVALALFAPGVLAPRFGFSVGDISLYATCVFAVGIVATVTGGSLIARFGAFGVATVCMVAVMAAMSVASLGTVPALLLAGLLLGLAFGPETPASSALLGRLARPEHRAVVFSVRQTGNQIGAMLGSVGLPLVALHDPRLGFAIVALIALAFAALFLSLRARYDGLTRSAGQPVDIGASLALLRSSPGLRALAIMSVPFSALQLALNGYLVSHAVDGLGLSHIAAGVLLAAAQGGGLAGRLGWGVVAARLGSTRGVLLVLGPAMGACAGALALAPAATPWPALLALAFLFGLTASGWNGVFLAEVARLAPEGQIGAATGGVLFASYAGLVTGPLVIAALAGLGGLTASYLAIGAAAALSVLALRADRTPG